MPWKAGKQYNMAARDPQEVLQAATPGSAIANHMLVHTTVPDSGRLTKPGSDGPKECEGRHAQYLHGHRRWPQLAANVLRSCLKMLHQPC